MRGFFKKMLGQFGIVSVLLLLQIVFLFWVTEVTEHRGIVSVCLVLLSVLVVFYILYKKDNPAFQLAWIVPILVFPAFGSLFYLVLQYQKLGRGYHKHLDKIKQASAPYLVQDEQVLKQVERMSPPVATLARYMSRRVGYSLVGRTETTFLPSGEAFWQRLLEELNNASDPAVPSAYTTGA